MAKHTNNNWINKHLRFALANACNKSESQITKEYLSTLKEIDLSDSGIKDLKGIEYAINLTSLNLSKNKIIDITPIKNLKKLSYLDLCENKIEDISFFNELINLKSIGLDCNNISHIPNLSNLRKLTLINISNNKIDNLSFIKSIPSKNFKIIASEQCILLNPVNVNLGEDYIFEPHIIWDDENKVLCDNVQVTGKYDYIDVDERPSILYSISKILIKSIYSDCIIKSEFYHEVPFSKSGILSGILIQPVFIKLASLKFDFNKLNKEKVLCEIYGKINLENNKYKDKKNTNYIFLKNKTITIINSKGEKLTCLTNSSGEYKFTNLECGRYTVLFPFINDYIYTTPSLYLCNLKDGESKEISSTLTNK